MSEGVEHALTKVVSEEGGGVLCGVCFVGGQVEKVEGELGAQVDNQEATGPKIKDAMRSYAQKGYKLVFGHGFEYNAPAVEVAKDFPETVFVTLIS